MERVPTAAEKGTQMPIALAQRVSRLQERLLQAENSYPEETKLSKNVLQLPHIGPQSLVPQRASLQQPQAPALMQKVNENYRGTTLALAASF